MSTELATQAQATAAIMERVLHVGDLSKLTPQERADYYLSTCESLGLNPTTRPFEYIVLNGKMTLYPRRDCTDQLRKRDRVSITITSRERMSDAYVVTARATTPDGRQDESIGAVPLTNLSGEALSNALMKAETKAKRRVTLSICGLGFVDESEVDSIPGARRVEVNDEGEVIDVSPPAMPEQNPEPSAPAVAPTPAKPAAGSQPGPNGPGSLVLPFGKHKGKALSRVIAEDRGYVEWLAVNSKDEMVRVAAQQLTQQQVETQIAPVEGRGNGNGGYITEEQRKRLYEMVSAAAVPIELVREWLLARNIPSARYLTATTAAELEAWIQRQNSDLWDEDETFGDTTDLPF